MSRILCLLYLLILLFCFLIFGPENPGHVFTFCFCSPKQATWTFITSMHAEGPCMFYLPHKRNPSCRPSANWKHGDHDTSSNRKTALSFALPLLCPEKERKRKTTTVGAKPVDGSHATPDDCYATKTKQQLPFSNSVPPKPKAEELHQDEKSDTRARM